MSLDWEADSELEYLISMAGSLLARGMTLGNLTNFQGLSDLIHKMVMK